MTAVQIMTAKYKRLIPERIEEAAGQLESRINERFPHSGLAQVAREILEVAENTRERAQFVAQPVVWLRVLIWILVLIILAGVTTTLISVGAPAEKLGFTEFVGVLESGINDVVFVGIAIFFLLRLEARFKQHKALVALDELRSLAHVIDMHQLTKDPTALTKERIITPSSPKMELNAFQLQRYLDYCSELLSLIGKLSAIFAQELDDSTVLAAVNDIESLTTALSRKIWQKLIILNAM